MMTSKAKPTQAASSGFHYDIQEDGIIRYEVDDLKNETVDQLTATIRAMNLYYCEARRHCRTLTNISRLSKPTPYSVKAVVGMMLATPAELRESVAILAPVNLMYPFLVSTFNTLPIFQAGSKRLFLQESDALNWLDQRLEELGP